MLQTVATNMIHNINRCWWRAGWLRLSTTVGSELNGCAATEPDSLRPANCFAATEYANLDVYDCLHRVGWLRCDWILLAAGFHNIVRLVCFHNTSQTKQSINVLWTLTASSIYFVDINCFFFKIFNRLLKSTSRYKSNMKYME